MLSAIGGAISRALKQLTDKKKTSSTSSSPSNNKTSYTSSPSGNSSKGSGNSYAYDTSGNKVNVTIKDGLSYLDNGQRVGAGYTVQTGGGIYKMGNDGVGVKVNSHNQYVSPTSNNNKVSNYNDYSNRDARSNNSVMQNPITDYTNQYNNALLNIYDNGNQYDNSVLRNMFTSDIINYGNTDPNYQRYGTFDITQDMRDGYVNAYDDLITKMDNEKGSKSGVDRKLYDDAISRYQQGGSSGNPNLNADVIQNYSTQPYQQDYNNYIPQENNAYMPVVDSSVNMGYTGGQGVGNYNQSINSGSGGSALDGLKPVFIGGQGEEIYKVDGENYIIKYNGQMSQISRDEYINYLSSLAGF